MLLKSNKAQMLTSKILTSFVIGIIVLIVLFSAYAAILPDAQSAGDSLGDAQRCSDATGFFNITQDACLTNSSPTGTSQSFAAIPLSSLFSGTGVAFVIVMAALIILVVKSYISGKK